MCGEYRYAAARGTHCYVLQLHSFHVSELARSRRGTGKRGQRDIAIVFGRGIEQARLLLPDGYSCFHLPQILVGYSTLQAKYSLGEATTSTWPFFDALSTECCVVHRGCACGALFAALSAFLQESAARSYGSTRHYVRVGTKEGCASCVRLCASGGRVLFTSCRPCSPPSCHAPLSPCVDQSLELCSCLTLNGPGACAAWRTAAGGRRRPNCRRQP